jgi:hypothetical protein
VTTSGDRDELASLLHEWFFDRGCSVVMAKTLAVEWADRIVEEEEAIGGEAP